MTRLPETRLDTTGRGGALVADRLERGKPPAVFPIGRRCAQPGCRTILSRYNPGSRCAAHQGWTSSP